EQQRPAGGVQPPADQDTGEAVGGGIDAGGHGCLRYTCTFPHICAGSSRPRASTPAHPASDTGQKAPPCPTSPRIGGSAAPSTPFGRRSSPCSSATTGRRSACRRSARKPTSAARPSTPIS